MHLNACCLTWWCVTGWTVPILANAKIRASPSLTHPTELFPIPDSRFPIPDSRFPAPCSLLPAPCSLKPINLYLRSRIIAITSRDIYPSIVKA
ncbi:MAG: hypothetical protein F6J99_28355 [Moorea sp. SIO4G3]|nr:hypothetical protein [Moorena sp. SIO4G3]